MHVVQRCPNLVDLRRARLIYSAGLPHFLQALRTFHVLGFRLHLRCLLDRGGKLQALAVPLAIMTTA